MLPVVLLLAAQLCAAFRAPRRLIEPPKAVTCFEGNTKQVGCESLCRRLELNRWNLKNGQCDEFLEKLKEKGYGKLFGPSEPSLEPIVKVLRTNCEDKEYAFFLEVILKFIDMVPEKTRDVKYAEELHGLQKKVLNALKKDDPDYEADLASCQNGDTAIAGCRSVCGWLGLTKSSSNGQCDDYVKSLKGQGYKSTQIFFWDKKSSMDPILEILNSNCRKEELGYYLAGIIQLIDRMPQEKKTKYLKELTELENHVSQLLAKEALAVPDEDYADDDTPLPKCDNNTSIEAGDVLTWQHYGPDFEEISSMINESKNDLFENKLHFRYGSRMDYSAKPFDTSTDIEFQKRSLGSKTQRLLVLSAKHCGNAFFKVGQAFADAGINLFLGIGDLLINLGKVMGRGTFWTGQKAVSLYGNVRQTTKHTDPSVRFTHTEIGVSRNRLATASHPLGVEVFNLCGYGKSLDRTGHLVISRFVGDGTVDAAKYRALAAERVLMWQPYLSHYSDTVGQWYRSVLGKCLNVVGTPGSSDYFQAVTPETVQAMWDYTPALDDSEKGFTKAIQDSFRTHEKNDVTGKRDRVKPKAMFCSKFVSAIWSSTIGNPTNQPEAPPRSRDLKKMLPFNPGACSPWTMLQWMLSSSGRKSWKSCIADLGNGKNQLNPCRN